MLDDRIPTRPSTQPQQRPPAVTHIGTGWPALNHVLERGFRPGELVIYGAGSGRPGVRMPAGLYRVNLEDGPNHNPEVGPGRRPWPFMSTQVLK